MGERTGQGCNRDANDGHEEVIKRSNFPAEENKIDDSEIEGLSPLEPRSSAETGGPRELLGV